MEKETDPYSSPDKNYSMKTVNPER